MARDPDRLWRDPEVALPREGASATLLITPRICVVEVGIPKKETEMLLAQMQSVFATFAAVSLVYWLASHHRRNARTWESLVARLEPARNNVCAASIHEGAEDAPLLVQKRDGLRKMHRQAGVMVEMADYAERNGSAMSQVMIDALREDAIHVRLETAKALAKAHWARSAQ